ncbi:hypothetical protein DVQ17_02270 [Yersinia enterocolitica]|nr:hypothetical protein [Yersinia enterocolitica]
MPNTGECLRYNGNTNLLERPLTGPAQKNRLYGGFFVPILALIQQKARNKNASTRLALVFLIHT